MKAKRIGLVAGLLINMVAQAGSVLNTDKGGVALSQYDAVSYFKPGGPKKGSPRYQATHDGATYLFENEENKQAFLKAPKTYAPQFGGWCAYAVATSKSKVEIDPESYLIQDGRLLLFYKGFLADTRKKWQETKGKDAATFLKEADANWPEIKDKES
jgi:YHS domain-containing protein